MSTPFEVKKRKILQQLAIPDQEYTDASPKGSLDEAIRDLVAEINDRDGFVTTSSCAGRVAVYAEGGSPSVESTEREDSGTANSTGGKGGGKWLYVSHDAVDLDECAGTGELCEMLGVPKDGKLESPQSLDNVRFTRLKFEPMILHVLTASLPEAQQVLSAALSAGFRESGISSITTTNDTVTSVMVAVRTAGLMFDSIIGYVDSQGQPHSMVSEDYLRALVQVANQRFAVNTERKERFRAGLNRSVSGVDGNRDGKKGDDWEPAEIRKERKKAEGLKRQQEVRQKAAVDSSVEAGKESVESFARFDDEEQA